MNLEIVKQTKYFAALLVFFMFGGVMTVQAQQVRTRSDYAIVQGFNNEFKTLSNDVENATTVNDINSVISQINSFDSEYSSHKTLLDKVLYPDTYEQKIESLKNRAQATYTRLNTIQEQSQKIAQLNQQVADYASQLKSLTEKSNAIEREMKRARGHEMRLERLTREYRASLKKRNDFILSVIDSLMITYKKLNVPSLQGLEASSSKALANSKGNALKLIESIAKNNTSFLDAHPTLTADEYLRMYAVQEQFSDMWNTMGDKLLSIYASNKERSQARSDINNALSQWHSKVADYTFKSIASAFKQQGINLSSFNDSNSFYTSLRNYLDNAIKTSRQHADEAQYKLFQKFSNIWNNTVKTKWADNLVQGKILSYQNIATIDQNLTTWGQLAQPKSYAMFIYLGIALIIIIILGILLFRAKSGSTTEKG